MLDEKKVEIQNSAVKIWFDTGCKGTLNLATGSGKTFCFLMICQMLLDKYKSLRLKVLFLAETNQREIDLKNDIDKFIKITGFDFYKFVDLHFACYQSAYKWENTKWDLVCADEIHSGLTPQYSKFFQNNKYLNLVGLSATVDRTTKYTDENGVEYTKGNLVDKIAPVVFTYSLNDSVKNNTSKKLFIYIINHRLDVTNKIIEAGTKDKKFLTTEQENYDYWDNEFKKSLFLPDGPAKTFRIRNTSAARAKLLYIAPSKITVVNKLLSQLKGKTIVFGNSIDALNQITKNTISNRNSDIKNALIRQQFADNKINTIGSFKMLKQGANLPDLDNTIIHSYYSKELDFIQMLGRQRNSKSTGNVFILKTAGTVETKWYSKAMETINNYEIIECANVEDCINKYSQKINEVSELT